MSKRMSAVERASAKQAVRRKQMSKQCERSNKRTSEWPGTQRVDFMPFLPKCSGGGLAVAMAVVHGGMKLHDIDAFISKTKT